MLLLSRYRSPLQFLAVILFIWTGVLLCFPKLSLADKLVTEYQIKAVFIYNLTNFITWPKSPHNQKYFIIGIYGDDPFGTLIDKTVRHEKIGNKPIKIVRLSKSQRAEVKSCDILFISSTSIDELSDIQEALNGSPVLTVGDRPGSAKDGVMVNLLKNDQNIQIEINHERARKVGFFISSKLLNLARIIN